MYQFLNQTSIYNSPVRLTEDEQATPNEVILRYFEDYSLSEVRHYLWLMMEICLTTGGEQFAEPEDRANQLNFFYRIEGLIEAAYIQTKMEK